MVSVACGLWLVACGLWLVACGLWLVACGWNWSWSCGCGWLAGGSSVARQQRGTRGNTALLTFTGEGARKADEGARAQRSAAFDFGGWQGEKSKSSWMNSRPRQALRATPAFAGA